MQETQETRVGSPGREDPLEREMAAHSVILAWEILCIEEPGGYRPWGHRKSDTAEQQSTHTRTANI